MSAFLGVAESLTGRRWVGLSPDEDRLAEAIAQGARLPVPVANVLARRGVPEREDLERMARWVLEAGGG